MRLYFEDVLCLSCPSSVCLLLANSQNVFSFTSRLYGARDFQLDMTIGALLITTRKESEPSVNQTRRFHFFHIYIVPLCTPFSQTTTILDKDQERKGLGKARECGDDESVL